MRMTAEEKAFLNLAGEFAVASELNRRQILASVTYGASKCADVFALSSDLSRVVRIEVKATTDEKRRWLIGPKGMKPTHGPTDVIWVLVRFPVEPSSAPHFFVLSQQEVHDAWEEEYKDFIARRGGRPFTGRGVPGVRLKDVQQFEGAWQKIVGRLAAGNSTTKPPLVFRESR
jgi:hypothetical protein